MKDLFQKYYSGKPTSVEELQSLSLFATRFMNSDEWECLKIMANLSARKKFEQCKNRPSEDASADFHRLAGIFFIFNEIESLPDVFKETMDTIRQQAEAEAKEKAFYAGNDGADPIDVSDRNSSIG